MTTFHTSREIPAPVNEVFGALSNPVRLSHWWGPDGFTNTFNYCDIQTGGRWLFIMHGPNGIDYDNESQFVEVDPPRKVVIQHVSQPRYRLTIELEPSAGGTLVSWTQVFENAETGRRLEHIVVPGNEQNLDRLTAEVLD